MTTRIAELDDSGIMRARISGLMTVSDQRMLEATARKLIDAGHEVRMLVTLEGFEGWEKSAAWDDSLLFWSGYGNAIARMAIVGEPRWKDGALVFVGKGFRNTRIEFFAEDAASDAEAWILGA
jgi:hypothetical protein